MIKKKLSENDTVPPLLAVIADLLHGKRHSRRTIAELTGKSLPTADRWIEQIEERIPHIRRVREGKTTWIAYDGRQTPSRSAASGACIAASLGALFAGSQQERNLKDARDYVLRERGEVYDHLDRKFVFAPRGGESALPEAGDCLDEVVNSLLQSRLLRFEYAHNSGARAQPTIAPLSLVVFDHQFYVFAKKHDGDGLYPYRFARMARVEALEDRFEYPSKGEYDPTSVLAPGFGIHIHGTGRVEDVEVVLSGDWANYALSHRWHPSQRVAKLGDGQVRVTLQVRLCRELETWVLGFGECAVVQAPNALVESIARRLSGAVGLYAKPIGGRPSIAKASRPRSDRPVKRGAR